MYGAPVGSQRCVGDTTIVPPGNEARLFGINVVSSGTTAIINFLTNGSTNTTWNSERVTNVVNIASSIDYGINGIWFPNGMHMTTDNQGNKVIVHFRRETPT